MLFFMNSFLPFLLERASAKSKKDHPMVGAPLPCLVLDKSRTKRWETEQRPHSRESAKGDLGDSGD